MNYVSDASHLFSTIPVSSGSRYKFIHMDNFSLGHQYEYMLPCSQVRRTLKRDICENWVNTDQKSMEGGAHFP
jgi:hypothetical protein